MSALSLEDRRALDDLLITYCAVIDARDDADAAAEFFTDDGVMDNRSLGSPLIEGRAAVAETIAAMFASMAVLEHFLSNFRVLDASGDTASVEAYVQAFGTPNGGDGFGMRGAYRMDARRIGGSWKIARLTFRVFG